MTFFKEEKITGMFFIKLTSKLCNCIALFEIFN